MLSSVLVNRGLCLTPISLQRSRALTGLLYRPSTSHCNTHCSNQSIRRSHKMTAATETTTIKLPLSRHIQATLAPCVVLMKDLMGQYAADWKERGGIQSLAQGVVYWRPPQQTTKALLEALTLDNEMEELEATSQANSSTETTANQHVNKPPPNLHLYGPDEGLASLRQVLEVKIARENSLTDHAVMVTAGANQAYMNVVLTLLDQTTKAVVFAPYYFNHVMALQMTISNQNIVIGTTSVETGYPDLDWLEQQLQTDSTIKLVTLVNPGNPTGTYMPRDLVQRAVDLCRRYNAWLVLDCTYEYFVNADSQAVTSQDESLADSTNNTPQSTDTANNLSSHSPYLAFDACFADPHVIHIFSLSKSYALAGYRCGYCVMHKSTLVYDEMLKVQDTIPIAPSRIAQVAALGAIKAGPAFVAQNYQTLNAGRTAVYKALTEAGCLRVIGGSGAMYFMGQLKTTSSNDIVDDVEVARLLVKDHGIAIIPGTYCGWPGWIRVAYANLPPEQCIQAADRLKRGLYEIMHKEE
jgi:aromatic aminotransferase